MGGVGCWGSRYLQWIEWHLYWLLFPSYLVVNGATFGIIRKRKRNGTCPTNRQRQCVYWLEILHHQTRTTIPEQPQRRHAVHGYFTWLGNTVWNETVWISSKFETRTRTIWDIGIQNNLAISSQRWAALLLSVQQRCQRWSCSKWRW